MEKVLLILSDNNKGNFISKGFSDAFRGLNYFVYEKKAYDLFPEEITKIAPDIVFVFWTNLSQRETIRNFIFDTINKNAAYIHCAEFKQDIPEIFYNREKHYIFAIDNDNPDFKYIHSIHPQRYKTKFSSFLYKITFCGNPASDLRENILAALIYNFGQINIFCRSYDFYKSVENIENKKLLDEQYLEIYRKSYKGYIESQKELAKIYAGSKINIDMVSDKNISFNYRCLEIMASGGFLIAPYNDNTVKYFDDGIELETYNSTQDLIDKIKFYLSNINISKLISEKGRKSVINNFSFYDRLKAMLKVIYGEDISNR